MKRQHLGINPFAPAATVVEQLKTPIIREAIKPPEPISEERLKRRRAIGALLALGHIGELPEDY